MTTVTHDLSPNAVTLLMKHNGFAEKYNIAKITAAEALTLVYNLFEDTVNSLMLWLNDTHFFSNNMSSRYDWYCHGEKLRIPEDIGHTMSDSEWVSNIRSARMSDEYYTTVYDPVWLQITQIISCHIPTETYTMWNVGRAGDFAVLIRGDDYRIVQWHMLLDSKKIPPPSNKRQLRTTKHVG